MVRTEHDADRVLEKYERVQALVGVWMTYIWPMPWDASRCSSSLIVV